MITAIVQYKLPDSISKEDCEAHFHGIAEGFRSVPGLHRKNFIFAEDRWAGGVYLWQTREDAERFYSGPWQDGIRSRYGMDPIIKYFDTFAITDNVEVAAGVRTSKSMI
jgi:Putative mono-oxygenase ydhR